VQIDGYRTAATAGLPVVDGLSIEFHTKSLPTARLVWHCPFIVLFYSSDIVPEGEDYKEFALIRLDGESWQSREEANNRMIVNRTDEFDGWDSWKKFNHEGYECKVTFERHGNVVVTTTQNCGLFIRNITTVVDGTKNIYACITGDQVALTNIRIKQSK
ncbi:MAG: diguanylate cyclase, partial [Lachnospiraceae bacterium]|nr:diguanylate cyclase [Lachnospiraceae bacterium]